ncbi:acyl-CoA thioesterase [Cohnella caldifontis]|uniref:acyl-CoA thioesterase n=1 Tax=Cohnella caldifontis TaxID=3027471 RepID=UPI0023EC3151|nr:acyl-CoA thioesterase [Cohnella sp. YIM B05605]
MNGTYPGTDLEMTVTWGDCDAAGIHYYARTFDWFTNARMKFLADHGFPYMETFHHPGISLVCLTADCRFKKMLKPEERITVRASLTTLTRSRLAFDYRIYKSDGQLAAEGTTSHAYVDPEGNPYNLKKRHPGLWASMMDRWPVFQDE